MYNYFIIPQRSFLSNFEDVVFVKRLRFVIQSPYSHKEGKINMKRIKALACVLSVAMIAGLFAGCSGKTTTITTEKFAKACEKLKLEEFDVEDSADPDDYETGIYSSVGEDDIEDYEYDVEDLLGEFKLDEVIDVDDVLGFSMAAKCTGLEDLDDVEELEDIEDLELDGAFALHIALDDNYVEDVMDVLSDTLKTVGIRTKNLSGKEYYVSEKAGYLRLHIDVAQLGKILLENDDIVEFVEDNLDVDEDDFADILNGLKGDVAISVEINESNIFVIAGGSLNSKASTLNSFCGAFGASNPTSVPMNKELMEDLVDKLFDMFGSYAKYITF